MKFSRPYDMSKFRKEQNSKLKIKDGFYDPITWIDTGSLAMNKMISGNFHTGIPIGSITTIAGASGSGKSLIASGNVVRNALEQGISVCVLDTENAVKKTWAESLGVPTEHEGLIRWAKTTINEVAKTIADFMDGYADDVAKLSREEQPPVLFVIDSLGNLDTETSMEQFKSGDLKGDKGIFAKQLKAMLKATMGSFEGYQVGMLCTNHTYKSQSIYEPEDIIGGGVGPIFLSDIVVSMNKGKLKENSEGDKLTTVQGIRAIVKCVKSRYAKPFEEVELRIPYDRGMDKYSGLFDMFEQKGLLVKSGNKHVYTDKSGKDHSLYRKNGLEPAHDPKISALFDLIIAEYDDSREPVGVNEVKEISEDE